MAYNAHAGSFNIDSSVTAGNDQSVTGVGFEPKIVLFWWSGSAASGDSVAGGNIAPGFGAAISSTSRFACTSISEDGSATSDTGIDSFNDGCIRILSDGGGAIGPAVVDGAADFFHPVATFAGR